MRLELGISFVLLVPATGLLADVTPFNNKAAWQTAVNNNYTTIDFSGFPELTFITTQYADLGVTFSEGNDNIDLSSIYLNDGAGLHDGLDNSITMLFASPMNWIAVDFPGVVEIDLYWNDQHLNKNVFNSFPNHFGGIILTQPFDKAVFTGNGVIIDDLHFGPPIPAPSALAILGVGAMGAMKRRRR